MASMRPPNDLDFEAYRNLKDKWFETENLIRYLHKNPVEDSFTTPTKRMKTAGNSAKKSYA